MVDVGGKEPVEVNRAADARDIGVVGELDRVEIRQQALVGVTGFDAWSGTEDVRDLVRIDAVPSGVEFENARVAGHQQRQAGGAEDRLLGALERHQRVVGVDDEDLRAGVERRHQPADRDLQRAGGAVTGVLDLEVAAIGAQTQKVMHPRADGLLLVGDDSRGDDQQADGLAIGGGEHRAWPRSRRA